MMLLELLNEVVDIDTDIFLSLNRMHSPFFDYFMSTYSGKWIWIPMYAAIWYVMLRNFHWKVTLFCMVGLALVITIADQTGATLIRPYVERLRPSNLENPISDMVHIVNGRRGGRYGFPSCHAANTFALTVFLSLLFKNKSLTFMLIFWATLNSYSRIYLGVHYPGDILFGTLAGCLIGYLMYLLYSFIHKRIFHQPRCISNKYTASGYLINDINLLFTVLLLTYFMIILLGFITAHTLNL